MPLILTWSIGACGAGRSRRRRCGGSPVWVLRVHARWRNGSDLATSQLASHASEQRVPRDGDELRVPPLLFELRLGIANRDQPIPRPDRCEEAGAESTAICRVVSPLPAECRRPGRGRP